MGGLFKSRSSTVTQDAMLTPEQKAAMATLSQLGQTGSAGGINLGDAYTGSLGDFNQTGTQTLAGNKLYDMIYGGNPTGYDTAKTTLTGLANNQFNPDDPSSGFAAFQRQVARQGSITNDALNREAAITGDRYSTAIGRSKADLGAQMNDQLVSKLGELYNAAQDRSYNAANALGSLETQAGNNARMNLGMGFDATQGGLQNTLNNAAAQAKYQEFQRARNEKLKQIDALNTVFNKQVPYGVMSSTATTPSPFSGLLNAALGAAGTAIGGPVGGAIGSGISGGISSLFSNLLKK